MGWDAGRIDAAQAASLLGWWLESGVDAAIGEEARDWIRSPAPAPAARASVAEAPTREVPPPPDTLAPLLEWLRDSPDVPLATTAARRILPHGPEAAPIMLISEMPGVEDAADGKPIGGEAWLLATRMLAAIHIPAETAYVATLSCFHAPGTRLSPDDLAACAALARRHVAAARPKRLLLFGDGPSRALLGRPLAEARGHVHKVEGVRAVATFHPRQLLARPSFKAQAWRDLLLLMEDET
jgi:DNA polymerase